MSETYIRTLKTGTLLRYETFVFSGGEIQVKFDKNHYRQIMEATENGVEIMTRAKNSEELFRIALLKDALSNLGVKTIELFMPYLPYARQDRICVTGEAFSLKVLTNFINSLNFDKVTIYDPHSDVGPALINNVKVVSQLNIFHNNDVLGKRVLKGVTFVSPDAGANKKTAAIAGYFGHTNFIRADKLRDLSNGNIKETIVYADDLRGQDVMIVDDICDGGRTFIELAKALKAKNAGKIILYVTHGIFSKGFNVLLEGGIDEIYTTNSFISDIPGGTQVTMIDIF